MVSFSLSPDLREARRRKNRKYNKTTPLEGGREGEGGGMTDSSITAINLESRGSKVVVERSLHKKVVLFEEKKRGPFFCPVEDPLHLTSPLRETSSLQIALEEKK